METKRIVYKLALHVDSFNTEAIWNARALTPFQAIAVGDRFAHNALSLTSWSKTPSPEEEFRVKDIQQVFWERNEVINHKVQVKLEIVTRRQIF